MSQSEEKEEEDDFDLDSTSVQFTRLVDGCLKTECLEIDDNSSIESIVQRETKHEIDIDEVSHNVTVFHMKKK